jgi:hypothetical protein
MAARACVVCRNPWPKHGVCPSCERDFDRRSTPWSRLDIIAWAARRALGFERRRHRKPRPAPGGKGALASMSRSSRRP